MLKLTVECQDRTAHAFIAALERIAMAFADVDTITIRVERTKAAARPRGGGPGVKGRRGRRPPTLRVVV